MTKIYFVRYTDLDDYGELRAFTSEEEAERYADLLTDEVDVEETPYIRFFVSEIGLYNKIEDING